ARDGRLIEGTFSALKVELERQLYLLSTFMDNGAQVRAVVHEGAEQIKLTLQFDFQCAEGAFNQSAVA
ncbi:hypothetical protein QCD79_35105, partial [Pseudomonas quasicaspiana]|nr:hypothetical protein [Pseudomonas quasicaspiana]